jgi:hypothetical protein
LTFSPSPCGGGRGRRRNQEYFNKFPLPWWERVRVRGAWMREIKQGASYHVRYHAYLEFPEIYLL